MDYLKWIVGQSSAQTTTCPVIKVFPRWIFMHHPSEQYISVNCLVRDKRIYFIINYDLPVVRSIIHCVAVCVDKMFDYYSSIHFGLIFGLSEEYAADNGISEHCFRCVHWHLPISMRRIKRECAAHPWNHSFIIGLVISNERFFLYRLCNAKMFLQCKSVARAYPDKFA